MVAHDYLSLKDVALNPGEEWVTEGEGLFLVFPIKGEIDSFSGLVTCRLAPGDVLVANQSGNSPIRLVAKSKANLKYFSICLELLYPLFASEEIPLLQGVVDSFRSPKLHAASSSVAQACHRPLEEAQSPSELLRRTELLRVASAILSEEFKQAQTRPPGYVRMEEHLAKVLKDLTAEDILNLSASELALKFSLSRRHLNRVFHEHFGVSAGALRMEMRLLRAMSLMLNPAAKVIHVAEQCGFHHLGLFNTCFKRRFGLNPSQCRKRAAVSPAWLNGLLETDATCALRAAGFCSLPGQTPSKSAVQKGKKPSSPAAFGRTRLPARRSRHPTVSG